MTKRLPDGPLLLAFFLSGAAALGYEILWTRLLAVCLGHETLGVLGVLAGFFGGMLVGAFLIDGIARRSRNPGRLFAGLELVAAGFAVVSPDFLYWLARSLPPLVGAVAGDNDTPLALLVSIGIAGVALLPGTLCLGASFPALAEARRRAHRRELASRGLGRLYAANTLGAATGVLGSVYVLLPAVGLRWGSVTLAAAGSLAAFVAWRWSRGLPAEERVGEEVPDSPETAEASRESGPASPRPWLPFVLIFGTGLAGLGFEVVVMLVLGQVLEDTIYTFANLLSVYLFGTAVGAWLMQRLVTSRRAESPSLTSGLLLASLLVVGLTAFLLRTSPGFLGTVSPTGSGYGQRLFGELALGFFLFFGPTLLMGATFSHLMGLLARRGVGRAYAVNTLGAALAPFLFGVMAVHLVGYAGSLLLVGATYFLLFTLHAALTERSRVLWGAVIAGLLWLVSPSSLSLLEIPLRWKLMEEREGVMGVVRVLELEGQSPTPIPHRRLQVNQNFRMGGGVSFAERRMGHVPMLVVPDARRALFLGVGTGATLGAAQHHGLEELVAVEIVPEVIDLLPWFDDVSDSVRDYDRLTLHSADARRFVAAEPGDFDVIVADLFHPGRRGAGSLFSREHFETLRAHLRPGGVMAQWIPLHQFDLVNFSTVSRTFLDVFPDVHAFLGIYNAQMPLLVFLGSEEPLVVDVDRLRTALGGPAGNVIENVEDFFGAYFLDRSTLLRLAGAGPLNTDLHPRIVFDAPRVAYGDERQNAFATLESLLAHRTPCPESIIGADDPRATHEKVHRFWTAAGHYLQAEIAQFRAGGTHALQPQALELLFRAYETEPEFSPVRGTLFSSALFFPQHGEVIYRRLLAITPDSRRVYEAYLGFLRQQKERARYNAVLGEARRRFGAGFGAGSGRPR